MATSLYVSADDLRQVAANLQTKKEEILNVYNSKVKAVMEESKEAIVISGLNFDEFNEQFRKAFVNLSDRLDSLSNALTTQIIPQYENLNMSIKKAFNVDFANQMTEILKSLNS